MEISHLDHLVLTVADISTTLAFYNQVLGMGIQQYGEGKFALQLGNQKINLHQYGKELEPKAKFSIPGSADLCFVTKTPLHRVIQELQEKLIRLRDSGVSDILIDPGFGFAKTIAQNFSLMKNLSEFHKLGCPLLVGISRKGMIYNTLKITAGEALNGTTILNTLSLQQGASILRVHDVKPAVEAVKLWMVTSGVNEKIVI